MKKHSEKNRKVIPTNLVGNALCQSFQLLTVDLNLLPSPTLTFLAGVGERNITAWLG